MSRLRWVVSAWLVMGAAPGASAYTVEVISSPTGAEVHASPANQPAAYLKGKTPCVLELGDDGAPHVLTVRSAGHFPAYRYTRPGDAAVSVTLQALDAPEVWQRLPGIVTSPLEERRLRRMWLVRGGLPVGPLNEGLPEVMDQVQAWAPDAGGAAVRGVRNMFGPEPITADLWWAPLRGQPQHVWRAITPSDLHTYSIPECSFSPDPRWLVCSAGVDGAEHLRLHCLATGQSRGIAHLVVSLDGGEVRQVPEPPEIIRNPGPREGYIQADGDLHLNPPDDAERRLTWFGKIPDLAPTPRAEDEQQ